MGSLHFPLCFDCLGAPNVTLSLVTRCFFATTFNFNLFCCCCSILKGPGAHLRLHAFEGGSRLDWSRLPPGLWAHGVSNMAAAAGEGNAVQELHCEHKAKAEGEGRDLTAAPPSLPPPKKNRATPTQFLALIFRHSGPHGEIT